MLTTYHNHTTWSDGHDVAPPYLDAARRSGVQELGFSDHYTLTPGGGTVSWSVPLDRLDAYVREISALADGAHELTIRLGVEADFFPETVATVRERLAAYPFDYVIGSVHFVDDFPIDEDAAHWVALTADERDERWRQYWQQIAQMAESGLCDIVGHLDLPKKFGYRPTADLHAEASAALDAIAAAGIAIELNTNGWNKPAAEAYPSLALLREVKRRGIPLLITADAHYPGELTQHFAAARTLASQAGYEELARFERRQRIAIPMTAETSRS